MSTLVVILLAIIAYILWRIYRQRENEKRDAKIEKFQDEREQEKNDFAAKYPHLVNKPENSLLHVLAMNAEKGLPLLKAAFLLYLHESTKIEPPGSFNWDTFWDLTEELLEHLEKFHEGPIVEYEIAVCAYWQIAATAIGKLIEESPEKRCGRVVRVHR